ncbi:amidase [Arthrobacter sp. zg-Y820]|uniref:amidase n=1 Tax=unclassified Arthrobacter TaxID=235627 RepID=UPI001E3DCB04|nr:MULTISPECIES: amidase [unclassified Arthrobacter]MCC9197435.1 amidase [Arthrobacter sp. zg-Y820]MDK1280302.1 amidase [Arthrobacter sp. zg.Y820]MDK1360561.1 amidase [Arthrobacter sp. zg-Y1219]WIB09589.1 amidase [Arthrobacter sp. zg-Y820]
MSAPPLPGPTSPSTEPTALQWRDRLASGEVSAREVTGYFLRRIEERNPALGAFLLPTPEPALREAAAADERFARGEPLGLLHGMPLAHKDLTDVAGIPTTLGTAALEPYVPAEDGPLPAVLRGAGAISLGKTQVPEFGLSSYSENFIGAPARNPLDPMRSPGGSSGGSAAAVAAGMIPFAPGTDGGGSVRIPAAATGLVGLKPNRGRVPAGGGQNDLGQFVVAGPLARNAADAGLLLDAMVAGPNHHATSAAPFEGSFLAAAQRAAGRFRIGVSTLSPFSSRLEIVLDPEAVQALTTGIRALTAAGHDVVDAELSYDERYPEAFQTVWTASLATLVLPEGAERRLTPLTAAVRRRALQRSAGELASALDVLRRFEEDTIRAYSAYDMILTPALGQTPRPVGWYWENPPEAGFPDEEALGLEDYARQCRYSPFTSMVNVCGLPAISVPTLRTPDGLSMGIQLIGRPGAEAQLLAVAAQLES